ncbi:hypothetical protein OF846_001400 [Rhodotorula toruloides]|nr:hypothetical protein OF846_001400 [Rhodotorula toruloides]
MTRQPAPRCPIARLPTELLLQIVRIARDDHDADIQTYSTSWRPRSRQNPVLAFSHVCRAWRQLAETTGELWSSLYLDGEIDGAASEAKALWWQHRAAGGVAREGTEPARDGGIRSIFITRAQDYATDDFAYLCESLDLVQLVRLRRAHISWMGGGPPVDEHRQLQSFFRFLLSSAPTLTSLSLHTPSHLRILFSLPRFGATFSALTDLEVRSCKISSPASDAYLLPAFLPRYSGETDWAPLTSLRRLILVGPIWRLRFRDGTVASPTLSSADVPCLEYAHFSSTTPPVHWDILSHSNGTLRHLALEDHFDHPTLPNPDTAASFPNLVSLKLTRSAPLVTRLFDLAVSLPGALAFENLIELALPGARLQQKYLNLFGGDLAPHLRTLDLSDTTAAPLHPLNGDRPVSLNLPHLPALETLLAYRVDWTSPALILETMENGHLPRLSALGTDLTFSLLGEWKMRDRRIALVSEEGDVYD